MSSPGGSVAVGGSERQPLPGSVRLGLTDGSERIEVTVLTRGRGEAAALPRQARLAGESVTQGMSRQDFATQHAAAAEDLAAVEAFARQNNLDVVASDEARRSVTLAGSASAMSTAFGVELVRYHHASGGYRGRAGAVLVPSELGDIVQGVFGLDNRPQAEAHIRLASTSFTPVEVGNLYSFPSGDAVGETIAIIELGGGFSAEDLDAYFRALGLPSPTVEVVSVDGGRNAPTGDPGGPDGEVMLDIEVAAAVAPGARIAVYFTPNTDRGFLDAVSTAVHDDNLRPSVVSISWGSAEERWTSQAMNAFDRTFQDAAVLGVTVCVAAGDNGSSDGVEDGSAHVDFPASSPYSLACGGTRVSGRGSTITSEVVWNDGPGGGSTGGGVSDFFPLPDWQTGAGVPPSVNSGHHVGRGLPDVCGDADPVSGYNVRVDGQETVVGGTSAVAPLWAGLVALINKRVGYPVGYLSPLLYRKLGTSGCFRDITQGSNGDYKATAGWDPCTGFGSPVGTALAALLEEEPRVVAH